jgi:hypothetical protein
VRQSADVGAMPLQRRAASDTVNIFEMAVEECRKVVLTPSGLRTMLAPIAVEVERMQPL